LLKRALSALAVSAVLVVGGTVQASGAIPTYSDFQASAWWAPYVEVSSSLGIFEGYPNGTFQPNGEITRAEWATVLDRIGNYGQGTGPTGFKDVVPGQWYTPDVAALVTAGIIRPADYPGAVLDPNGPISRLEMATWAGRVLGQKGVPLQDLARLYADGMASTPKTLTPQSMSAIEHGPVTSYGQLQWFQVPTPVVSATPGVTFSDLPSKTPHYGDVMETVQYGVIQGFPGGTFQPAGETTRAQAAKVAVLLSGDLTTSGPNLDPQAVLQGMETAVDTAQGALPKTGATAAEAESALQAAGIGQYAAPSMLTGQNGLGASLVAFRQNAPGSRTMKHQVLECRTDSTGAAEAEAECAFSVSAISWTGTAGAPQDFGTLVFYVLDGSAWKVSAAVGYQVVPPWFKGGGSGATP